MRRVAFRDVVLALWVAGCGGAAGDGAAGPGGRPTPDATLSVVLTSPVLEVGQTLRAVAYLVHADGRRSEVGNAAWSVTVPAVASAVLNGEVTALAVGETHIVATSGSRTGEARLTVVPVPVAAVEIAPSSTDVPVGARVQLRVVARDRSGNPLGGRGVRWSSGDTAVVRVSGEGELTGVATGIGAVTADIEGIRATVPVRVTASQGTVASIDLSPAATHLAVGAETMLRLTVRDAGGAPLTDRTPSWLVTIALGDSVIALSPDGRVRALSRGVAVVEAQVDGLVARAQVTVNDSLDAGIVVRFAEPDSGAVVSDTLKVVASVSAPEPVERVEATIGATRAPLRLEPIGRGGLAWVARLDVRDFKYGPYELVVTATTTSGAMGRASRRVVRDTQEGESTNGGGPRSK
ncbi:MAG TPA: Ig-like domain-containing protein [Gemmatimonadaceae bacterium]|nr:Ig-like domain-containing protein [Gemmatimonadaceae bacterium]